MLLDRHPAGVLDPDKDLFIQREWSDVIELVQDFLVNNEDRTKYSRYTPSHAGRCSKKWCGVSSNEEVLDLLQHGWGDDIQSDIDLLAEAATLPALKEVTEMVRGYDICGYDIDIPRYLEGEPEYFHAVNEERSSNVKVISLVVGITYYAAWTSDMIKNRGMALLSLIQELEAAGRDVELIVADYDGCAKTKGASRFRVVVKKAGEQFDISRLRFALCHPAMLRKVMFMDYCREGIQEFHTANFGDPSANHYTPSAAEYDAEFETCFLLLGVERGQERSRVTDMISHYTNLEDAVVETKRLLFNELKRIGAVA